MNEHTANKVLNLAGVSNNLSNRQSGLQITSTATQFGSIDFESDPFFAKKYPRLQGSDKTTDKAPAAPVADGVTPVAVVNSDTKRSLRAMLDRTITLLPPAIGMV